MKLIDEADLQGLGALPPRGLERGAAVTIGMFDGVHRGHRHVLATLRAHGDRLGVPTALVTFDPHPRALLRGSAHAPRLISSLSDRLQLLALTGAVDFAMVLRFDGARAAQSAREFTEGTLLRQLRMKHLVVGENFACGQGRQGTVGFLAQLGASSGFTVDPVPLATVPASCVPSQHPPVRSSSTEARRLIALGDLAGARAVLERAHELSCTVSRCAMGVDRSRVIEVKLPPTMCAPAAADYVGEVRATGSGAAWTPALLRVGRQGQDTVHLVPVDSIEARAGEQLRLRFLDRVARHDAHPDRTYL
ncbi:FMN adenylyltransferase [Variovorax sp. UC122_21]|uniref:FMN adenylyltransferase n=1 Tax=Variovorax sp. UC122_21 TaxID=3374554 RepID=UPI00375717C2